MDYASPILFHGPSARARTMAFVPSLGRLLCDPVGDEGLKIAQAREIIELMNGAPVGDRPGVIVMGPMDMAQQNATDVLLKSIEEFDQRVVRPVLWAADLAEVSPTIRSRCLGRWCPGPDVVDEDVLERARELVDAALRGDVAGVIGGLAEQQPRAILEASARVLRGRDMEPETTALWERLRAALSVREPSANETLVAFL